MISTSRLVLLAGLLITCQFAKAEETKVTKESATRVCESAAIDRYGEAQVSTKVKKQKIGRKKGYAVSVKVKGSKRLTCLAYPDGEVLFVAKQF